MPIPQTSEAKTSRANERSVPSREGDRIVDCEVVSVRESKESWKDCEASETEAEIESDARVDAMVERKRDENDNRGKDTFSATFLEELNAMRLKGKKSLESLTELNKETKDFELKMHKAVFVLDKALDCTYLACVGQGFKNESEPMNVVVASHKRRNGLATGNVGDVNPWNLETPESIENNNGLGICVLCVPLCFKTNAIKDEMAEVLGPQFHQTKEVMLKRIHEVSRVMWRKNDGDLGEAMKVRLIVDDELDDYIMRKGFLELRGIVFKRIQRFLPPDEYFARKRARGY